MSDFEASAIFIGILVAVCLVVVGFAYLLDSMDNKNKEKPKNTFKNGDNKKSTKEVEKAA